MISIGNLQINKLCLGNLEVVKAYLGDVQVYGSTPQPVGKYMTMTVLDGDAGTTISPKITGTLSPNLQYRVNNGEWSDFIVGTTADIHAVAGDVIQWKGVNESGISTSDRNYLNFAISGNPVALSGNIMSLIDGVGDALVIPNNYCFYKMFSQSNVKTVSSDFLPATTIKNNCYASMFEKCATLEKSPNLPAIEIKWGCYSSMFSGCTSLVTAPELHSTITDGHCYDNMFKNCTSLVTAPSLPATKIEQYCYYSMFSGCTSLKQAPEILPGMELKPSCYSYMFSNCKSLEKAPNLPATKISNSCYEYLFSWCDSLKQAPEILPAMELQPSCYSSMFTNCTSLEKAPNLPSTTINNFCYSKMFSGCTSLKQAPEILPAMELKPSCYSSMFYRCTSLEKAPELPSQTLVERCYNGMFYQCSKLNYVKCLATEGTINSDGTAPLALQNWLSWVAPTGTFEKPAAAVYVTDSPSGIPAGWTVVNIDEPTQEKYMTMTVLDGDAGTTISPTVTGKLTNLNLQYRINNGDWNDFIVGTTADIKVVAGDAVQWKGMNTGGLSVDSSNYLNFAVSGNPVALSGNIMSLIDGIGDALEIPGDYCFYSLFMNSNIKTVSSDFLPATTLTYACYRDLFNNCQNLTQAPDLPATNLNYNCYHGIFYRCTSLTTAPVLPATKLISGCYGFMFAYCNSLNYVKCLATEGITIPNALLDWLFDVSSTGTFVKPAGVTYETGVHGIPQGWTVEEI